MNKISSPIPVLVTAVGSELAMAIIKALKCAHLDIKLIGTDIFQDAVGKHWCDDFYIVPPVTNVSDYETTMVEILKEHGVRIVIPTSDFEYSFYHDQYPTFNGAQILIQPKETFSTLNDKWLSYLAFKTSNIGTPDTWLPEEIQLSALSYPIMLKPRTGGGSRHIFKCADAKDLEKFLPVVPNPIIQECIEPDNQEYTAGVFRDKAKVISVIVLKRTLKFGMTNKAEVVRDIDLEQFCKSTAEKLDLYGSINIQFRMKDSQPKILEINPRFSGTTGIRAAFGFNDAEMWIRDVLHLEKSEVQLIDGSVSRYMEEKYEFE